MSLEINPERMRQLANEVRTNAEGMAAIVPIAGEQRDNARDPKRGMDNSELATKLQEVLDAFDKVVNYEVKLVGDFCTDTEFVADVQEELDRQIAEALANQAAGVEGQAPAGGCSGRAVRDDPIHGRRVIAKQDRLVDRLLQRRSG
ncbi:hypothetical protein ACFWUP_05295 [Nocardia sp. NPDC058658]|uniref:hypothetical protein n=1 Tax=Nocardia sp. NPDC058658 TaxID=3346580 RepID=UPI0036634E14